jgi:hypothetical protein
LPQISVRPAARSVWRHPLVVWSVLLCGAGVLYLALVQQPAEWAEVSAAWRARLEDDADNRVRVISTWLGEELRDASFAATLTSAGERLDTLRLTHGLSGLFVLDARLQPTIAHPPDAVFQADYAELVRRVADTGVTSAEFFFAERRLVLLICADREDVEPAASAIVCLKMKPQTTWSGCWAITQAPRPASAARQAFAAASCSSAGRFAAGRAG